MCDLNVLQQVPLLVAGLEVGLAVVDCHRLQPQQQQHNSSNTATAQAYINSWSSSTSFDTTAASCGNCKHSCWWWVDRLGQNSSRLTQEHRAGVMHNS